MARSIITVTEYPSMPGRFIVTCNTRRNNRGYIHPADVSGAAAAAAKALEYAIHCGNGYAIIAPASVKNEIPGDMLSRDTNT